MARQPPRSRINHSIKRPIKRAWPPRRTPSRRAVVYLSPFSVLVGVILLLALRKWRPVCDGADLAGADNGTIHFRDTYLLFGWDGRPLPRIVV